MRKVIVLIIMLFIFICGLCGYLIATNLGLRKAVKELEKTKEKGFNLKLSKEKELIEKDLYEKYRADMVSFEAMRRKVELQKKRIKELEERLE